MTIEIEKKGLAAGMPRATRRRMSLAACLLAATMLTSCGIPDRFADIGKPPTLSPIQSPTEQPGYTPVRMPMPAPQVASYTPNSLWQSGSRTFFKDQRARQIGDILTVKVAITDSASLSNTTERSRASSDSSTVGGVPGALIGAVLPSSLSSSSSSSSNGVSGNSTTLSNSTQAMDNKGVGTIGRSETITTNVAAIVTQVLPNGNFVIEGRQQVRVNFEMRELLVAGVIRPEDVSADNMIESAKIAEARISYGGKGQLTDVQQPRYGAQAMDVLLPF